MKQKKTATETCTTCTANSLRFVLPFSSSPRDAVRVPNAALHGTGPFRCAPEPSRGKKFAQNLSLLVTVLEVTGRGLATTDRVKAFAGECGIGASASAAVKVDTTNDPLQISQGTGSREAQQEATSG